MLWNEREKKNPKSIKAACRLCLRFKATPAYISFNIKWTVTDKEEGGNVIAAKWLDNSPICLLMPWTLEQIPLGDMSQTPHSRITTVKHIYQHISAAHTVCFFLLLIFFFCFSKVILLVELSSNILIFSLFTAEKRQADAVFASLVKHHVRYSLHSTVGHWILSCKIHFTCVSKLISTCTSQNNRF